MRPRVKLALLCIMSYVISVTPLIVTFAFNLDKYTMSAEATVKLTFGGLIVMVLLLMRTLGRTLPNGIGGILTAFMLAFLLDAILSDLVLLLGMFLLGESLDIIFVRRNIKRLREDMLIDKTAIATAKQVEAVLNKRNGGGRV